MFKKICLNSPSEYRNDFFRTGVQIQSQSNTFLAYTLLRGIYISLHLNYVAFLCDLVHLYILTKIYSLRRCTAADGAADCDNRTPAELNEEEHEFRIKN